MTSITPSAADMCPHAITLPQDYQRFLLPCSRRAAGPLNVHERDYRSGTINTDALGFRFSQFAGKRYSVAEPGGSARVNLLVGGSTALGVGASSDAHTVASHLSMLTGEVWLSLAGCGHNATQELLMFLDHQHRFGEIGHVVVFSGMNTVAQEALGETLAVGQNPEHVLAFNERGRGAEAPRPETLLQRLRQVLASPRRSLSPTLIEPLPTPGKRLVQAADRIGRTLLQWQRMLAGSHTTLTFILQPLLPWCRETLPQGEQAMLEALEAQSSNVDRLLSGVLHNELHAMFFRRIRNQCEYINCYDMNTMLSSSPVFAENLFVDRLHFNDLGNNAMAKVITAKLGLVQEKYSNRRLTPIKLVRD